MGVPVWSTAITDTFTFCPGKAFMCSSSLHFRDPPPVQKQRTGSDEMAAISWAVASSLMKLWKRCWVQFPEWLQLHLFSMPPYKMLPLFLAVLPWKVRSILPMWDSSLSITWTKHSFRDGRSNSGGHVFVPAISVTYIAPPYSVAVLFLKCMQAGGLMKMLDWWSKCIAPPRTAVLFMKKLPSSTFHCSLPQVLPPKVKLLFSENTAPP